MLWVIDTILLATGVVLAAGFVARRRLRRRYPAPGELVKIGRQRLHLDVHGTELPTVIFEAGLGDYSATWDLVQPSVAEFARTVTYDRAGLGWSRGRIGRRTVGHSVEKLHQLLEQAGIDGPYVLVGQSYGGLISRLFAHRYPDEVAGMVLIDAAHEDQFLRASEPVRRMAAQMARLAGPMYLIPRLLAWLGISALRPTMVPTPFGAAVPEAFDRERYQGILAAAGTRPLRAMLAELRGLKQSQEQLRAARGGLGDLPLVVLAHGRPEPLPASITEAVQQENEILWRQLQQEIADSSTQGRLVIAEGSGHAVQIEDPQRVIDAVRQVVAAAQPAGQRRAPDQAPAVPARPAAARVAGVVGRGLLSVPGRVFRGAVTIAAVLFVLAMIGMTYETLAGGGDAEADPPAGRLIDVGGHRLHLHCVGEGSPTVVVDAGGGDFSLGWRHIQQRVADTTRICTYDRAGHGWSEPGPMPRSADRIVSELHTLLAKAGEEGPYVLIGHSLSAKYVRLYAGTYAEDVVGIVIADGRDESFDAYLGHEFMERAVGMTGTMNGIQSFLRETGVVRLFGAQLMSLLQGVGLEAALGPDARTYALLATSRPQLEAFASELAAWQDTNSLLASTSLGDLPVIVLAHGKPLPDADQERAWQQSQAAQAALSTIGRVIVIDGAGHAIQFDAPEALVDAIGQVAEAVDPEAIATR